MIKMQPYEGICSGFCSHFHEQTGLPDQQTAALLLSQNKHKLVHGCITSWCALCSTDAEHFLKAADSSTVLTASGWEGEAGDRSCLWVLSSGPYMGWSEAGAADSEDLESSQRALCSHSHPCTSASSYLAHHCLSLHVGKSPKIWQLRFFLEATKEQIFIRKFHRKVPGCGWCPEGQKSLGWRRIFHVFEISADPNEHWIWTVTETAEQQEGWVLMIWVSGRLFLWGPEKRREKLTGMTLTHTHRHTVHYGLIWRFVKNIFICAIWGQTCYLCFIYQLPGKSSQDVSQPATLYKYMLLLN